MKRKRHFFSPDTFVWILAVLCLALAGLLVWAKPSFLLPAAIGLVLLAAVAVLFVGRMRRVVRGVLFGGGVGAAAVGSGLAAFSAPAAVVENGQLVWYNDAFLREVAASVDVATLPVYKVVPGLDLAAAASGAGQNIEIGRRRYSAYSSAIPGQGGLYFVLFIENTALKVRADEYFATRPSVLYFDIDTFEEVFKGLKESRRAAILSEVEAALEEYIGRAQGFLRRVSGGRFLAVVEERAMQGMAEARFDILDTVRAVGGSSTTLTLSIGVGRRGADFSECEEMAMAALDMALGRGGDQAAVKAPEGFSFYGGRTQAVEKSTRVKSRAIAAAIRDMVLACDRVLIMGHKESDMDAIGAAVGMLRFCRLCNKQADIVVDVRHSLAGAMLQELKNAGYGRHLLSPAQALPLCGPRTLAVVVDTHAKWLLESEEVYAACGRTVVIDHHRRMVGHIDNAMVFYHEPTASSASEMVAELLQYIDGDDAEQLTAKEAEMLLAGIMLDTRTFSLHVGVRTFEAAAFLRRAGAQSAEAKKLFATSMEEYLYKCHLVSQAEMIHGCAVAISDEVPEECEITAPQAANELLSIEGVEASLVAIKLGGEVRISARSMGKVNVQLIMEKLGGGGHLTMAGAQLAGASLVEAKQQMLAAVAAYRQESGQAANGGNGR